jgi:hypothetical protein
MGDVVATLRPEFVRVWVRCVSIHTPVTVAVQILTHPLHPFVTLPRFRRAMQNVFDDLADVATDDVACFSPTLCAEVTTDRALQTAMAASSYADPVIVFAGQSPSVWRRLLRWLCCNRQADDVTLARETDAFTEATPLRHAATGAPLTVPSVPAEAIGGR